MSPAPSAGRRSADNLHALHLADRSFGRARRQALQILLAVAAVQMAALVSTILILTVLR